MAFQARTTVEVDRLRLDRQNPRLVETNQDATDEAIIARLYVSSDLEELLQSISANGYMDIEPLVVLGDPGDRSRHLTVLEGNRRLAALRLLRDQELVARVEKATRMAIRIPEVANGKLSTLDHVSVYAVADRADARSFIGFKHINGPARWDAYAKARFAAHWYSTGRNDDVDLQTIARAIGDKHDTIKRMVSAIYVLEQAKNENLFDIEDRFGRRLNFSHLYTALSRSQFMDYLGLEPAWATHDPHDDQVPRERLEALRNVLVWIYGSKIDETEPVIRSQNPDIKRLGEVLANAQALHVLETKRDLDAAHASLEPVDRRLTTSLIKAREHLNDAVRSLRGYDGKDQSLLDIAADIRETSDIVHGRMKQKRKDAGRDRV
ncbi:MAG: ParB N-terminal domain-containing protein [Alphaproteobacteria bacterium]|nr:ParB N-terminal domain-containing protein [Alphaproteobacteria bacterium]